MPLSQSRDLHTRKHAMFRAGDVNWETAIKYPEDLAAKCEIIQSGDSTLKHPILNNVLLRKPEKPLYHYTTQTGLLGIIKDRQIWATHTQYLNDRREFLHAVDLVRGEIHRLLNEENTRTGEASTARMEALNRMRDALSLSPEHINVCVCSFSEASDSLSQWRAYGGSSGFALGFSHELLQVAVEKKRFFLAQCIYDPATQLDIVRALVEEVLDEHLSKGSGIEDWEEFGDEESAEIFWKTGGNLLDYLYRYAPMLKDQAFEEEREWRIISRPVLAHHLDYREGRSLIIPYYRLPLWTVGQKTEINEIIVGPTRDVERSIKSVSRLIRGRDVIKDRNLKGLDLINGGYTPIKPSQVPYRDW
jgi:DUF2971 family protein